jgi:hypothetical protein
VADSYVLPISDEAGGRVEAALADSLIGYPEFPVYDELGAPLVIPNSPAAAPPTGMFPVLDEFGVEFLIPFELAQANGLYERTANSLRTLAFNVFEDALGVPVEYDNGPIITANPVTATLVARVYPDFRDTESAGFAAGDVLVRATGELVAELRGPLQLGDEAVLSYVEDAKNLLRGYRDDLVRTFEPYHVTRGRDGAWHVVAIYVPFRAEDALARSTVTASGQPRVGAAHDAIRAHIDEQWAVPNDLDVVWDNYAPDPPDALAWARVNVLTGQSAVTDHGRTRRRRYPGIVKVSIHLQLGRGDKTGWRLADALADATRAASPSGVRFGTASARRLGRRGRSWVIVVDVPFRVDELA